ncbi:MAG: cardiolipin synthase [Myxococcales bacterium]|nr:cardiolipin synthase [Myxococcales bacterium]
MGGLALAIDIVATAHVVLTKRDGSSAMAWAGLIWLAPILGVLAYLLLGINRIQRRAADILGERVLYAGDRAHAIRTEALRELAPFDHRPQMRALCRVVDGVTRRPLVSENAVKVLVDGDAAYPEMLGAIAKATRTVTLASYIFDNDAAGRAFVEAIGEAVARGVEVRVLLDDMGARYTFPTIDRRLRKAGARVARFLPANRPWRLPYFNLRNHRKILVVDGTLGFTGGMNIRESRPPGRKGPPRLRDLHFRIAGPVVRHLQEVFAEDWAFTTGERLEGDAWFPALESRGDCHARGIADGPDEDFEKLRWVLLAAIGCARRRVIVLTPYFLPDDSIATALNVASMRGVDVDIVMPEANNLPYVKWASMPGLGPLLEHGCRLHFTPKPFDHSKLMVVDGLWTLLGSTNWDARSLRLNFEFNVEVYSEALAAEMEALIREKLVGARRVTLEELERRRLPTKLRDGVFRLFSPYL